MPSSSPSSDGRPFDTHPFAIQFTPQGHLLLRQQEGRLSLPLASDVPLLPPDNVPIPLRQAFAYLPDDQMKLVCRTRQLLHWREHSRFCPACGTPTEAAELPILRRCPACRYEIFPTITPAVLVLVRRGEDILLVQTHTHAAAGHYGLVAGFLEVGESLEECAAREVGEETGLSIENIRYHSSQPWPFPSNLMVGFVADYLAGDIRLQTEELADAAFYSPADLRRPPLSNLLPPPGSLSYRLLLPILFPCG